MAIAHQSFSDDFYGCAVLQRDAANHGGIFSLAESFLANHKAGSMAGINADGDEAAIDQLNGAERGPAVGDVILPGRSFAARRDALSERIFLLGLGIGDTMSGLRAVPVRHGSRAARAAGLEVGIIEFANADPPLAQPRDPDFTGADDASAGRFRDGVEGAPLLETEDALASVGCFALARSAVLPNRRVCK